MRTLAAVDTNVLVEVFSAHDLILAFTRHGKNAQTEFRRVQVRDALLLAIHFHNIRATTYSLHEGLKIMRQRVPTPEERVEPPEQAAEDGEYPFLLYYANICSHYVADHVIPDWTCSVPSDGDDEPTGSNADTLLVEYAREHGLPLITNEGSTAKGTRVKSKSIRDKAQAANVPIFTPREFYDGKLNEETASMAFLERFQEHASDYACKRADPASYQRAIRDVARYYAYVFYG